METDNWISLGKTDDADLANGNNSKLNGATVTSEGECKSRQNVKRRKGNKTGKKINRPTEYNYPQKCEFCGQVFLEKEMVRHKKVHPESFTLDCIPCGKSFNTKAAYDTHYNIHKIYHCSACKKDFNARKHYRSHMERIHKSEGERPRIHECDICKKTFKDKFVLNTHKKTHFNIKAHKCPICEYACNNLTYMRQHVMNHTNQLQYKCHICYRGFMTDSELQVHVDKLHANEPQVYSCNVCGKISTSKGNLRQHQKIHNPEHNQKKDHQCAECGKTFALKCRLKKHVLSHKGQDKCHCSICGKLLSKDSYKKHLKAHSGERPFLCDYCGESFTTNSCLMGHRRTHTGEKPLKPYICDQCGKSFVQSSTMEAHRKTHANGTTKNYPCDECGRLFSQASQLTSHRKVHETLFCDICGKTFTDHSLLFSHTNMYHVPERPYNFIGFNSQSGLSDGKDAKIFGEW